MLLLRRFGALTLLFCYLLQSPLPVWLTDSPVAADLCCSACSADGACCCLAATEGATACDMATITGALLQPAPCGVESMVLPVISSGPAYHLLPGYLRLAPPISHATPVTRWLQPAGSLAIESPDKIPIV